MPSKSANLTSLHDALANLCQLFAATVGEDDVKLFKYHLQYPDAGQKPWKGTVVEIQVPSTIDFKWNHSNLDKGQRLGRAAAEKAIEAYTAARENGTGGTGGLRFINELNPKPSPPHRGTRLQPSSDHLCYIRESLQLSEQCLRLGQVPCVEAFGKRSIDGFKQIACFLTIALIGP